MPAMSAFPSGPRCPVTINPPYIFARNARYEFGSLNTLALVTVLFGATVGSVQPVPATQRRAAATLTALDVRFMSFVPLEPDAQAGGDSARARIDVVVDSVQARGRIHAAVARYRERILDGGVQAERLSPVARGVAERDVIDPQERGVLHKIVRVVLRNDEPGREDRRVQVARHPRAREVLVGAVGGRHVVVDPAPQVRPDREAGVEGGHLVVVLAGGERSGPAQPGRAPLEHAGVQAELETPVPHAADVGRDKVPEVRAGGDGNVEDQISGFFVIPVDRAAVPLVAEADIEAGVVAAGLFPVYELIDGAGADGGDELVAELNLRLPVAVRIGRVLQVVSERLVAGPGPGGAQLQLREEADPPHEGPLGNPPGQRHRRQGAARVTEAA